MFYSCQTIHTGPNTCTNVRQSLIIRTLIQVEDIVVICDVIKLECVL